MGDEDTRDTRAGVKEGTLRRSLLCRKYHLWKFELEVASNLMEVTTADIVETSGKRGIAVIGFRGQVPVRWVPAVVDLNECLKGLAPKPSLFFVGNCAVKERPPKKMPETRVIPPSTAATSLKWLAVPAASSRCCGRGSVSLTHTAVGQL